MTAHAFTVAQYAACSIIRRHGGRDGLDSGSFGAYFYGEGRRSKSTSMGGGGDYAALMLLGRLKKSGFVCHSMRYRAGGTIWDLTPKGLLAAQSCPIFVQEK